ncbi:class I SAM-dependent methyltransferase [Streptomyces sp. NBC_00193]|uniref:class I SAM-dependent methyltransferase n=1 Tax=Streptomyces sp. NBC_00193 TaxID=2975675 RepID=UPI00224DCD31|nr:class I SAM-dependent methyltransferase [Streptomyces sp. NBC_00193]MCX5301369.1 class I SAM-dependent methyltransferase [Streptomyces sp. NBC_00193]
MVSTLRVGPGVDPGVDPANAEQARAWDGHEGAYWAEHADRYDRAIRAHHPHLLAAAGISAADRVLDIGCGTGETTRDAARRASGGRALGVDLSAEMLRVARERTAAEGLRNADFVRADAQVHPFPSAAFDVAVSRSGTMFFADPVAAFRNIAGALRPGGRLVQLVWQAAADNEWFLSFTRALAAGRPPPAPAPDAPGPFALADPERVRTVLEAAGLTGIRLEPHSETMWFGEDSADAERFLLGMLGWMLEGLDEEGRRRAVDDLRASLTAHETADGVHYASATWIIRAIRPPIRPPVTG